MISEDQGAGFDHEGGMEHQEGALDINNDSAEEEAKHSNEDNVCEGVLP